MAVAITHDVVEDLMDLEEGDRVCLEAELYEWAPFTVASVVAEPCTSPEGEVWIGKHIEVEPTDNRGTRREFEVYPTASPPDMGTGFGALTRVDVLDAGADATEFEPGECPWLERPADEIVDDASVNRSLSEVLDAVEHNDTVWEINQRIAGPVVSQTRAMLWELGVLDGAGNLLDEDVLEVRIGEIREVFC